MQQDQGGGRLTGKSGSGPEWACSAAGSVTACQRGADLAFYASGPLVKLTTSCKNFEASGQSTLTQGLMFLACK